MVFYAVVAHLPSAAFKVIVFIWKHWLVSETGWGMHPSRELAIPQHAGGGIKIVSDEGYSTHAHTHAEKSFTGRLFTRSAPNPDICTARGRGLDTSYPPSRGGCLHPSDTHRAPCVDRGDKQAFQGTACLTCFNI